MTERIGQRLGNYNLTQLLGQGGFAEVYLGEHVYLRTQAAVKVLQTRLSGAEDIESFLAEARTIARLSHPHVIRVLDFGIDKEVPFLVMDYASNGSLRQRHPKGTPLPLATAIPYVKQVADALQYAHDEKLIHRDIKPENILVGRRNDILLSDFGIALVAQSSRYQNTQEVIGTVAYMSPEQIQGKPRPASDQYSLGIVVYEWLSGERPFKGSFTELCTQHMFATPPPLHERFPGISPAIEQVLMIALAKDPKQRFGNVQAFANALEQAGKESQEKTVPSSPHAPAPEQHAPPPPSVLVQYPAVQSPGYPPPSAMTPIQYPAVQSPEPASLSSTTPEQSRGYAPPPAAPVQYPAVQPNYATVPQAAPFQKNISVERGIGKQENVWGLGQRRLLAMLAATLIYAILEFVVGRLFVTFSNNGTTFSAPFFANIGNSTFLPSLSSILFSVILCVPFFFGAEFGPWVGVVCVVVGALIGDILSGYLSIVPFQAFWYVYAGSILLGFFPGLAFLRTRGKYVTASAIRLALLMSALGVLLTSIVWAIGDAVHGVSFWPDVSMILIANLLGVVGLPVLLIAYARATHQGQTGQ